jgi:hypothetical protein
MFGGKTIDHHPRKTIINDIRTMLRRSIQRLRIYPCIRDVHHGSKLTAAMTPPPRR